jgi:hypothetical protein
MVALVHASVNASANRPQSYAVPQCHSGATVLPCRDLETLLPNWHA